MPVLNKDVPIPLYFQLENWILEKIKDGTYQIGESIPTESQLRDMFQISRTTVRQAIHDLVEEGWLIRNGTKGTFVSEPKKKRTNVRSLESFNRQIIRAGQTPRTEILELKVIKADEELAGTLGIEVNGKVILMFRRRFADEVAVMTIRSCLSYDRCRFILEHDFAEESLYEVLSLREDTKPVDVRQIVEAQIPTAEDMKLFRMDCMKPILNFHCLDRNRRGENIVFNIIRYRGDYIRFEVDAIQGTSDRNFCPPQ